MKSQDNSQLHCSNLYNFSFQTTTLEKSQCKNLRVRNNRRVCVNLTTGRPFKVRAR